MQRVYLSDTVAEKIKHYIRENNVQASEKLPTVSEWMETLKVSKSTIREGLNKLKTEGIVEVKNGKGIYVKEVKPFRIYTSFNVVDGAKHLLEILEVRKSLERTAIELAAQHATEEQLVEMKHHLEQYVEYRNENKFVEASEADSNFHRMIYKASNNQILYEVIMTLHEELYVLWETPFGKEELYDEGYPYHVKLLEGLQEKNKTKADEAFIALIESVKNNIMKLNKNTLTEK